MKQKLTTKQLLHFVQFTHKFQQVKRRIIVNHENRCENDSEHSYQLALLGWYIVSSQKLNYNIDLIIKYSLVHDLVEIYAGDTFFEAEASLQATKEEREQSALQKIEIEFPEISDITELIHKYESKSDPEAQFVYALDKMIPVLNIYLDNGRSWKNDKVSFEMIKNKDKKIVVNNDVMDLWLELMKLVEGDKDNLFDL